jgi:hypothetical protein
MKKLLLVFAVVTLTACSDKEVAIMKNRHIPDQCLRAQVFEKCMRVLPAGPVATQYNDWDEVVSECGRQSYYQSIRNREFIKPECQGE